MLQIEGFAKRYGDLQAVRPLDLEVGEGESFALLGPNGGGKTTVLRAIVGQGDAVCDACRASR